MNYMYVKNILTTTNVERSILILQSNYMELNYMNRKLIKNNNNNNNNKKQIREEKLNHSREK